MNAPRLFLVRGAVVLTDRNLATNCFFLLGVRSYLAKLRFINWIILMTLPTGNQSLMTFLFVVRVTRVGFPPKRWEVVFLAGRINVNYISNGSRDTLPLITRRTTSSHSPRFNNYTSDEINSASVAGVIIKICPPHRHRYHTASLCRAPCPRVES